MAFRTPAEPLVLPNGGATRLAPLTLGAVWILVAGVLAFGVYNMPGWLPDDGAYAHLAMRLVGGERQHLELQDVHPGLIHTIHAACLQLFGVTMRALRLPLIGLTMAQVGAAFLILRRHGPLAASLGACGSLCLGVLTFLNPTPHWYCLTLAFGCCLWLDSNEESNPRRPFGAGVLVGLCALLRQPSGVLLGLGCLLVLMRGSDAEVSAPTARGRGAKAVCGLSAAALLTLLVGVTTPGLVALSWSLGPLGLFVGASSSRRSATPKWLRNVLLCAFGALLVLALKIGVCLWQGALGAFYRDAVEVAWSLPRLAFFEAQSYDAWFARALTAMVEAESLLDRADALALTLALVAAPLLGALLLFRRGPAPARATPIIAACYALTSLHYQVPLYLYYALPLTVVGLIEIWPTGSGAPSRIGRLHSFIGLVLICGLMVPTSQRGLAVQALEGGGVRPRAERRYIDTRARFPACGLLMEVADFERYTRLIHIIDSRLEGGEGGLLALPSSPELYVLTGRRSPVRFTNSALGLGRELGLDTLALDLMTKAPLIVVVRRDDKYNTSACRRLLEALAPRLEDLGEVEGYELYRLGARPERR